MIAPLINSERMILKQLRMSNESLANRVKNARSGDEIEYALRRIHANTSTQDVLTGMIANRIGAKSVVSLSEGMVYYYVAKQTAVHV